MQHQLTGKSYYINPFQEKVSNSNSLVALQLPDLIICNISNKNVYSLVSMKDNWISIKNPFKSNLYYNHIQQYNLDEYDSFDGDMQEFILSKINDEDSKSHRLFTNRYKQFMRFYCIDINSLCDFIVLI